MKKTVLLMFAHFFVALTINCTEALEYEWKFDPGQEATLLLNRARTALEAAAQGNQDAATLKKVRIDLTRVLPLLVEPNYLEAYQRTLEANFSACGLPPTAPANIFLGLSRKELSPSKVNEAFIHLRKSFSQTEEEDGAIEQELRDMMTQIYTQLVAAQTLPDPIKNTKKIYAALLSGNKPDFLPPAKALMSCARQAHHTLGTPSDIALWVAFSNNTLEEEINRQRQALRAMGIDAGFAQSLFGACLEVETGGKPALEALLTDRRWQTTKQLPLTAPNTASFTGNLWNSFVAIVSRSYPTPPPSPDGTKPNFITKATNAPKKRPNPFATSDVEEV